MWYSEIKTGIGQSILKINLFIRIYTFKNEKISLTCFFCLIYQVGSPVGALLKPTLSSQVQSHGTQLYNGGKLLTNDLDSSLANLVGSEFLFLFIFFLALKLIWFNPCPTLSHNAYVCLLKIYILEGPQQKSKYSERGSLAVFKKRLFVIAINWML